MTSGTRPWRVPISIVVGGSVPPFTARSAWIPLVASVRWRPGPRWALMLGAGSDITRAPGTARWRAQFIFDVLPSVSRAAATHRPLNEVVLTALPEQSGPKAMVFASPQDAAASASQPPEVAQSQNTEPPPPAAAPLKIATVLQFELNSAGLLPGHEAALHKLLDWQSEHQHVRVEVAGYTDDRGPRPSTCVSPPCGLMRCVRR